MTWIELTDSAVKIGLGALIAGGFAYLNNRVMLKRDSRQRYATRRRDLLEKILEMVVEFDKVYRHQKALFDTLQTMRNQPEQYQSFKEKFDVLDESLRVKTEVFADISGILLMLGETDTNGSLEKFRQLSSQWYEKSNAWASETEANALAPLRKEIVEKREEFMTKLARIYAQE